MTFDGLLEQVLALLQREGRLSYRALKLRFNLDDDYLEGLKEDPGEAYWQALHPGSCPRASPAGLPRPARGAGRGAALGSSRSSPGGPCGARTEKRLLQLGAVIGKDVPFVLLQAIAELPEEALRSGLAHLQAAGFLYETSLFPEIEYTFKHALTYEVAYQDTHGNVIKEYLLIGYEGSAGD